MSIAFKAMQFAREVHAGQKRKYTGNPYTDHLAEVAGIVATVTYWDQIDPEVLVATAWLHDCIEDQGVTVHQLHGALQGFSMSAVDHVVRGVVLLSDLETGSRAERKAASRARLVNAPRWVQTIKYADIISNTSSIVMHDPKFAFTYLEEKRLLLDVMNAGDSRLYEMALKLAK
jgi:(p)ppGpp synthase/HD superfamily hydrolase